MYACLQKQVTYVATVFKTTKNLGDDTCVNKSINYIASSGKTSNVFRDTTSLPLKSDNDREDDGSFWNDAK